MHNCTMIKWWPSPWASRRGTSTSWRAPSGLSVIPLTQLMVFPCLLSFYVTSSSHSFIPRLFTHTFLSSHCSPLPSHILSLSHALCSFAHFISLLSLFSNTGQYKKLEEVNAMVGPSQAHVDTVTAWLRANQVEVSNRHTFV